MNVRLTIGSLHLRYRPLAGFLAVFALALPVSLRAAEDEVFGDPGPAPASTSAQKTPAPLPLPPLTPAAAAQPETSATQAPPPLAPETRDAVKPANQPKTEEAVKPAEKETKPAEAEKEPAKPSERQEVAKPAGKPEKEEPVSAVQAAAQPKEKELPIVARGPKGEELVPLSAVLNPPMDPKEKAFYDVIIDAMKNPNSGARALLRGKRIGELSTRLAAFHALDRALSIQDAAHTNEFLRAAVEEARAVFLPVFSVGPQWTNTNTFSRRIEKSTAEKIREMSHIKFIKDIPGGTAFDPDHRVVQSVNFFKTGDIQFINPKDPNHFYQFVPGGGTDEFGRPTDIVIDNNLVTGTATTIAEGGGTLDFLRGKKLGYIDPSGKAKELSEVWNYNVASKHTPTDSRVGIPVTIVQQLPWGPQLSITTTNTYRNLPYNKFNNNFSRPWFSSFNAQLFVPLPWTKNFGPYAPQDVSLKLAKLGAEQSLWDLKSVINTTIQISDLSYLNLVGAAKNLEASINNRATVEKLATKTADLLGVQRATQYDKDQVDAEVLRVRQVEEAAWQNYILVSDSMVNLLNMPPEMLLVPVGYVALLDQHPAYKPEEALATALEKRAELKSLNAAVRSAEVILKFQKQQSKPDLSATGSVTFSQTQLPNSGRFRGNTGIGFVHPWAAMANVFTPDAIDQSYSFAYRRSMFNRGEHARVKEAQNSLESTLLTTRLTENNISQQVNNALAALDRANAVLTAAAVRRESAMAAYQASLELRAAERVTDFEIVSKNQDWLDAEFGLIAAQVAYKQAETQLLFAEGTLPSEYPERTAPNEFDKYRLYLLKMSSALRFFGGGKDERAP
ncbi:MAG TPA: TolC family protein [Planctomycetota bacterium]|jgi:outer membrane protein TolC/outer membrane biosynthesis protein TonB